SRRRHTRFSRDWSSDVCSSDLKGTSASIGGRAARRNYQRLSLCYHPAGRGAFMINILLAEDQAMVRGALAALLGMEPNFAITQAEDGDQALLLLRQQTFDVLLTDIEMPGRSGLELAQWLQQRQSDRKST